MEEYKRTKDFIKSKQLWNVIKELLVIILGVTLAINFTSSVEKKQNKEKVITMLESVTEEIRMQYFSNSSIIGAYSKDLITSEEAIQTEINGRTAFIENILNNDTVIATTSPIMYSIMICNVDNINDSLSRISTEEGKDLITSVRCVNNCFENILWAIEAEIKHLQGVYSEKKLHELYIQYIS